MKDTYDDVLGQFPKEENDDVGSAYFWDRDGHLNDATGEFNKAVRGVWPRERLAYEEECDPAT